MAPVTQSRMFLLSECIDGLVKQKITPILSLVAANSVSGHEMLYLKCGIRRPTVAIFFIIKE
jgi:hypothetical protein